MKGSHLLKGLIAKGGILRIFSLFLFGLFFIYLTVSAGMVAYQQQDFSLFFTELGEEMIKPLEKAHDSAIQILSKEEGFVHNLWNYLGFYSALYKLYLWLWVFMIPVNFVLKENNPPIIRYVIGLFIFFTVQVVYSVIGLNKSPGYPFMVFKDIFSAIVNLAA